MSAPIFSLCHSTARLPDGWRAAHDCWKANCDDWSRVEYILGLDTADRERWPDLSGTDIIVAENTDDQCAAHGWNATGRAASGKVMITAADDMFPPPHWDTELMNVIPDIDAQYAVEVKSGTGPADDEWMRCMLHSIITRAYYKRLGHFFDSRFKGMYADVWFTEVARHHGVVIDARHLTFQHRHWIGTNVPFDAIYQRQNSSDRYDRGMDVLGDLRREGYPK